MPLNPDFMFETRHITDPLKRALGLPRDVWYLVLNEDLNSAYFLDAHYRIHTQAIKPEARPVIELAAQRKKASEAKPAPALRRSVLLADS